MSNDVTNFTKVKACEMETIPLMCTLSLVFLNIMAAIKEAGFNFDALIDHFRVAKSNSIDHPSE